MSKPLGLLGGLQEIQEIMKAERVDWNRAHDIWLDKRAPILSNVIQLDAWRRSNEHLH